MYGVTTIKGRPVKFGFFSVKDWLDSVILSFPSPWKVGPLDGKYYGTEIFDGRDVCILTVWLAEGEPSDRQRHGMTDVEWADYCCDTHWESELALSTAEKISQLRNSIPPYPVLFEEEMDELLGLILEHGHWDDGIFDELVCGGPDKRIIPGDSRIGVSHNEPGEKKRLLSNLKQSRQN